MDPDPAGGHMEVPSLPQASGSPPAEEHLRAGGWSQARAIESLAVVV